MLETIKQNFKQPKGLIGKLIGKIMAAENKTLNEWTIEQLKVRHGDHILEVGYGPGYSMEFLVKHYRNVSVDGIDNSKAMKDEATHRLKSQVEKGQIRLETSDISDAKLQPNSYYRVLAVNTYTLWKDRQAGLENIYQAVKPGGKIAITMQPRQEDARLHKTKQFGKQIRTELKWSGFQQIKVRYKEIPPVLVVCVTALKPK
ncbi:class I SAM-dependent methyltransferase [Lederbergia galactosidilytica]|uniref:SAM-dependent methlyltransferase n=1 Tax=Lederbergia galactosidilytica TaxID=217031 RepID=A0A177ZUL5_9BACI|nr:class I SAM-dependent methyltransferase [Lederbergia galactosidilytica]OAK71010.1 SAM-dependent methlyltransferase [Lederbergia galactosidilytica]